MPSGLNMRLWYRYRSAAAVPLGTGHVGHLMPVSWWCSRLGIQNNVSKPFSKTGANSSKRFTPHTVSLFDTKMGLNKGCVSSRVLDVLGLGSVLWVSYFKPSELRCDRYSHISTVQINHFMSKNDALYSLQRRLSNIVINAVVRFHALLSALNSVKQMWRSLSLPFNSRSGRCSRGFTAVFYSIGLASRESFCMHLYLSPKSRTID